MDLGHAFPPSRQELSDLVQLRAAGITPGQLKGAVRRGELHRVRRGVYSPRPLPPRAPHLLSGGRPDPAFIAAVRAVLLELGPRAVAEARTAAVAWGFDMASEPTTAEVSLPPGSRCRRRDVEVTERGSVPSVLLPVLGFDPLRVPTAVETVLQCAATLPVAEAVAIADSALRARAVTRRQLWLGAQRWRRRPGARRIRLVISLADARSESVLESVLRALVVTAGLGRPVPQFVIRDGRLFVARVDLCWPELRLVVEADGRMWHDPEDARGNDRRRDNALESLSWRVLRFSWAEVVHQPDYVVALVRSCLRGWMAAA